MYMDLDLSPDIVFPFHSIWNSVVPPKIGFFASLKRRGRALVNRCFLCEEDEETIEHLLIHYKKARMLWDPYFC